jgi:hypothetical protein
MSSHKLPSHMANEWCIELSDRELPTSLCIEIFGTDSSKDSNLLFECFEIEIEEFCYLVIHF